MFKIPPEQLKALMAELQPADNPFTAFKRKVEATEFYQSAEYTAAIHALERYRAAVKNSSDARGAVAQYFLNILSGMAVEPYNVVSAEQSLELLNTFMAGFMPYVEAAELNPAPEPFKPKWSPPDFVEAFGSDIADVYLLSGNDLIAKFDAYRAAFYEDGEKFGMDFAEMDILWMWRQMHALQLDIKHAGEAADKGGD